jgi:protein ImuA
MTTQALAQIISRSHRRARAPLPFLGALSLASARVHEFCGPSRRMLALMAIRSTTGPILWVRPAWMPERLHPEGVLPVIQPGRLIFVTPRRPDDLLWCFEECLRGGATPLVVAELPEPPGLTPVRRLHLAAETGAETGSITPTGLMLTPGDGGAQGVESRWHIAPRHSRHDTRWQLELRRARAAAPQGWELRAPADRAGFVLTRTAADPAEPVTQI